MCYGSADGAGKAAKWSAVGQRFEEQPVSAETFPFPEEMLEFPAFGHPLGAAELTAAVG